MSLVNHVEETRAQQSDHVERKCIVNCICIRLRIHTFFERVDRKHNDTTPDDELQNVRHSFARGLMVEQEVNGGQHGNEAWNLTDRILQIVLNYIRIRTGTQPR